MDKRITLSVGGDAYVSEVIRDSLSTIDSIEVVDSDHLQQSDIIYWVGGKGPSIKKHFLFWIKKDPLIINHWIGTDVLDEMEKYQQNGMNRIYNFLENCIVNWKLKRGGLINLAGAPWLVNELAQLDIIATYLPITTIDRKNLETVDPHHIKDIDFLSYVPLNRFDFYGGDKIVKLATRWQNYTFLIICADSKEIPPDLVDKMPKNVTISPRVERNKMPELYQRSKFFVRYTQHDSESLSVFEALYYKLQVLWTYDFPHTHKIETLEKISDAIPSLVKNWQPNHQGHAYVIQQFSIEKWREDFLEIIKRTSHYSERR
jgi:hypothetical protein